jgi:hypothetical protein
MLLISANLVQVFGSDAVPRGWLRWAWMGVDSTVMACFMQILPEPELLMLTYSNTPVELMALSIDTNKLCSLRQLLETKDTYQATRVYLLRASPMDLDMLQPPFETLASLQQAVQKHPAALARAVLEPHEVIWFWDMQINKFGKPLVDDEGEWTVTSVLAGADVPVDWDQSIQQWKTLTCVSHEYDDSKKLFTCFDGHAVPYDCFFLHTQRVNELLAAFLRDEMHLSSDKWLPSLMCPVGLCMQQVTPSYITRRAVLQQLPVPPVLETTTLLRMLKQKWRL